MVCTAKGLYGRQCYSQGVVPRSNQEMELMLLRTALRLIVIKLSKCSVRRGWSSVGSLEIRLVTCPLGPVAPGYDSVYETSLEPSRDLTGQIIYSKIRNDVMIEIR